MTAQLEFGTVSNPEETQRLGEIVSQCFNFPISEWSSYRDRIGIENFRCLRRHGLLVGGLGIYQMGQWWGGRCVPMAGIAAVGVVPEHRGTGVVTELLSHTLKELSANGVPLSSLYPATQRPYRKVGYEQGGTYCGFELPTDSIGLSGKPSAQINTLPVQPVGAIHHEVFHEIYRQKAIDNNGNLERHRAIWERLVQPKEEEVIYAYLVGSETQPEGYIIFKQQRFGNELQVAIADWVALTQAAARRLWTFLGDHRSIIKKVRWHGASIDPRLFLLQEQTYRVVGLERWMLRVIDVPKALSERGYPAGVEAELHLEVGDDLLPENNGKYVLAVSGGRGQVTKGGRGDLRLNVRGLAPLYTGLFTPFQLQLTGQLSATDNALAVAALMFAGSEPWMPDLF